jgi:hypothetical protein
MFSATIVEVKGNEIILNSETAENVKQFCDDYSIFFHKFANEPSIAFYRICQHIKKTSPSYINKKVFYF